MAYRRLEQRRAARRVSAGGARPPTRGTSRPTPEGGRRQAWTRVVRSRADAVAARLSSPTAGALAAAWSAVITLLAVGLVVIGAWIVGAGEGGITGALQVAGTGWLACHYIPISISGGAVSQLPSGLVVIPGFLLWRAGSWAARRSAACRWQDVRVTVGVAAAVYGTIGLFLAGISVTDAASVEPLYALIGTGIFALFTFGAGASREAGLWPTIADRFTPSMRRRIRATVVAVMTIAAGAAVLLVISLMGHFGLAMELSQTLGGGVIGTLLLAVLSVAYIPNALIWSISYATGPGFAVGESTSVSPFGVTAGAMPDFPFFAAIPASAPGWAPLVLLIPLVAGGLSSAIMRRTYPPRLRSVQAWRERLWVAGLAAGTLFGVTVFGAGALGPGRLSEVGPVPWTVAVATFALLIVGGLVTDIVRTGLYKLRQRRRTVDLTSNRNRQQKSAANS